MQLLSNCSKRRGGRLVPSGRLKPDLYFERKSTPYTQTILRTWGAYSRPPMPIYAVVIAQMASINTPTTRRLLRWPLPAFWSSADLETWMLDCHWLIARDLCVYEGFYATYKINPSPWNGTQIAIAYVCVDTRGDLWMSINHITRVSAWTRLRSCVCVLRRTEYKPGFKPGLYFERKSTPYTQTILRTWGAYSRPSMPIYAVVIAQMPSINTPTTRRRLRWPLPAFWSSADPETWMLDCHWLTTRDLCVYASYYAAYKINPSPWNGTQTAVAYVCVNTRGDLRRRRDNHIKVGVYFRCRQALWHAFIRLSNAYKSVLRRICLYFSRRHERRQRARESVARRKMLQSSTVLNFHALRQRTQAIQPIIYRCHELSLQRIDLAITS